MSKRLQVLFDESEYAEIQAIARHQRMSVAEWVRQTLRNARREEPLSAATEKRAALERASAYRFPTGDIDTLLHDVRTIRLADARYSVHGERHVSRVRRLLASHGDLLRLVRRRVEAAVISISSWTGGSTLVEPAREKNLDPLHRVSVAKIRNQGLGVGCMGK